MHFIPGGDSIGEVKNNYGLIKKKKRAKLGKERMRAGRSPLVVQVFAVGPGRAPALPGLAVSLGTRVIGCDTANPRNQDPLLLQIARTADSAAY